MNDDPAPSEPEHVAKVTARLRCGHLTSRGRPHRRVLGWVGYDEVGVAVAETRHREFREESGPAPHGEFEHAKWWEPERLVVELVGRPVTVEAFCEQHGSVVFTLGDVRAALRSGRDLVHP